MAEIRMFTKDEYINELYSNYIKYMHRVRCNERCLMNNRDELLRLRNTLNDTIDKNAEFKDTIEHQKDEIVKLKNLLFEKNRTIEEQCNKIDDMETEIDHLTEELNAPIGYLDLDLVDKQHEVERLKNLLKGKDYTIEQQLKVIDCYRKEIDKLKTEKTDTMAYAPVNFVLDCSNSSYFEYAKHLMRKYEALTDSGFSHDDAMSLIPLWDDADFEEFKKGN